MIKTPPVTNPADDEADAVLTNNGDSPIAPKPEEEKAVEPEPEPEPVPEPKTHTFTGKIVTDAENRVLSDVVGRGMIMVPPGEGRILVFGEEDSANVAANMFHSSEVKTATITVTF